MVSPKKETTYRTISGCNKANISYCNANLKLKQSQEAKQNAPFWKPTFQERMQSDQNQQEQHYI